MTEVARKKTPVEIAIEAARESVLSYLPRAVAIIKDLAESADNDRVRLAAAQDLADRAGFTKTASVKVEATQGQHEALKNEAEDLVARLRANAEQAAVGPADISLEAVIVHEGTEVVEAV